MTDRPVALVTGGSRGIGAAVCVLAGARGWDVSLSYQSDAGAAAGIVAAVESAGGRAMAQRADAADDGVPVATGDGEDLALGRLTRAGVVGTHYWYVLRWSGGGISAPLYSTGTPPSG